MLLEFKCSNHKSIKDAIDFSMIAGSDRTSIDYLKEFENYRVLPSAIIYGANGSGKSNFINALEFMCHLVCNSITYQPGQLIFQSIHKLSDKEEPSHYDIQFVKNHKRYAYGFSVKDNKILDEYLYYFPKGRQVKIFEREGILIKPGDKFKNAFEISKSIIKENRLFLSCAANYSNVEVVEEAFLFFKKDMVLYDPKVNNWTKYSMELMHDNQKMKDSFINVLQALGTGIKDIKVLYDLSRDINNIKVKVVYDQFEIDLTEESAGIQRLFQLICPIIEILNNGKILICDELETSLHESIIYQIVKLFQYQNKEEFAQLIFTTHDTSLLDQHLFRRDQIWFTQLNNERATDLYSLVEIRNVRKTENLKNGYISGKYGAIPLLNKQYLEEFEETINQ